jgi:competence protein ComEA
MFKKLLFAGLFALASLTQAAELVDINSADAVTIADALKGVGKAKAEAIVAYRDKNGPFKSIDELAEVQGIGEKTLIANRANLTIGKSAPEKTAKK